MNPEDASRLAQETSEPAPPDGWTETEPEIETGPESASDQPAEVCRRRLQRLETVARGRANAAD